MASPYDRRPGKGRAHALNTRPRLRRRARLGAVAVCISWLFLAGSARATLPWPGDDVDSRTRAEGRGLDQAGNPAYQRAQQPYAGAWDGMDPFRRNWSGTRGLTIPVSFPNRYGATLRGHLYRPCRSGASDGQPCPWPDPLTGKLVRGPLPAVVLLPGLGGPNRFETIYSTFAQQLADHGYIVLSVDPQGQGGSDRDPAPKYCEKPGSWQDPQEAGLAERGDCAGYDAPSQGEAELVDPAFQPLVDAARASGDPNIYNTAVTIALFASLHYDREAFMQRFPRLYAPFQARFAFAGIDAANWLVSIDNPWIHLVDTDRVGIAGHSAGADGAIIAGNAHRDRRFRAAVAWDTFGTQPFAPLGEMVPTVPTMIHQSEQAQFAFPWGSEPPDPELLPAYSTLEKFGQVDVASISSRCAGPPTTSGSGTPTR
jgi:dienelactone hydrolase